MQGDFDDEAISDANYGLNNWNPPHHWIQSQLSHHRRQMDRKNQKLERSYQHKSIWTTLLGHHKSLVIEFQDDDTINEHSTQWEEFANQQTEDDPGISLEDMR